ncbi:ovocleidin-116-like [Molothrus aeneus]|uniref:ovocleidin-116-like n=1 Tax=Molothrus aeneus TaxID=84833 RepID=UPI0034574BD6
MQTSLACLCLCLLSTAFTTPVPSPLPERAAGNCVGQHRIFLKSCNAKHGFYIFKYVYSFSTRRNQTQIKKEEADHQSTIPSHRMDEGNARREPPAGSAGTAPEHSDNSSSEVIEYGIVFNPENRSTPDISRDGPSPHPGTGMRARGSGGGMGPTPSSSEGSGDLDLVLEVDGGVPILPQGERPSEVMVGNRSRVRSENKDDGAPRVVPVGGAMTAGRAPTTRRAGDEGSGEATVSGQGQESVKQGTGTGDIALSSVTKMEDVQVDAAGVDEYAYVPDSGSVTITHGSLGSTDRANGFTQVSPGKDDEVNIFIGRANIHMGEQVTTQAGATVSRENDRIPSVGSSRPLHRLDITVAPSGDEDDSMPARRQPESLATTATPTHADSITSSLRDNRLTGEDEEGATTIGIDRGLVTPVPWRVTSGDITSPTVASIHRKDDDEVRGEGQKSKGKQPDHVATATPHHRGDMEATITVPAKGGSVHPAATERDRTTPSVTASSRKAGMSTVLGRRGSGEVGIATSTPSHVEARPGAGMRVHPGGAGLDKTPRMDKTPLPTGKPSGWVSSGAQKSVGSYDGDAGGRSHAVKAGASPAPQAGQATGSMAAGRGQEWGRGAESGTAGLGAGGGRLPGHHGRRLGAGVPGTIATLGRSRQLDQVKRADELHVRERAFYSLGGAGGGPHGPYPGLGSADSSQSSEGDRGSHSESGQTGLQPSGWGSPGYPQGRWIQGPL